MKFTKEQYEWMKNELHKHGVAVRHTSWSVDEIKIQFENGYKTACFIEHLDIKEKADKYVKQFETN